MRGAELDRESSERVEADLTWLVKRWGRMSNIHAALAEDYHRRAEQLCEEGEMA